MRRFFSFFSVVCVLSLLIDFSQCRAQSFFSNPVTREVEPVFKLPQEVFSVSYTTTFRVPVSLVSIDFYREISSFDHYFRIASVESTLLHSQFMYFLTDCHKVPDKIPWVGIHLQYVHPTTFFGPHAGITIGHVQFEASYDFGNIKFWNGSRNSFILKCGIRF